MIRFPSLLLRRPLMPLLAAAAALALGAGAAPAQDEASLAPTPKPPAPAPPARKRPPLRVATLSNGLRLLCRTSDAAEIVSVVCLVRAGLPDEPAEKAGVMALTAEALLRGTTTHPGRSFLQSVTNAGGNLRATPGYDFTEISLVTSKSQLDEALKLVADVLAHPRLAPEDINDAREAVKRRIHSFRDDFTGASYQTLTALLYPQTPYGRSLNGFAETLDRLTAADVQAFWKKNYVQNRMTIAVVGDIDSTQALTVAQKAFQEIPRGAPPVDMGLFTDRLPRPRVEFIEREGPAAQVMIGFLAPGATPENYPVYALLDAVVGGGKRARMFSNIREKHSLGYEMGSFYQPLHHQSHLVAYVVTPAFVRDPQKEQARGLIEPVKELIL
ncbi:MAG TPA: pitrilysin family protein, partial [Armatimonadota bacterium]|nr:pitrilysin family protein [Armatimonadota bacterium]